MRDSSGRIKGPGRAPFTCASQAAAGAWMPLSEAPPRPGRMQGRHAKRRSALQKGWRACTWTVLLGIRKARSFILLQAGWRH